MSSRWRRPSLRATMIVPILLAMLAGLIGFGVTIDRVQYANRLADIDDELVRAARRSLERPIGQPDDAGPGGDAGSDNGSGPAADTPPRFGQPADAELEVIEDVDDLDAPIELLVDADGEVVDSGREPGPFSDEVILDLLQMDGIHTVESPRFRVIVTAMPGNMTSITALSLDDFDAAASDLRRVLLVAGLVIVGVQLVIVWALTTAVVRPVAKLSRTARRVADGELDIEIEAPTGSREMADLAIDFDRMLERLRANIESAHRSADDAQRAHDDMERFVADVSHEFRTPLTALRGYSDLYAGGLLADAGSLDRAMERIGAESVRLHELVSDMLTLTSRHAHEPERFDPIDPVSIVRDVTDDLRSAFPRRTIDRVENDLGPHRGDPTVLGSSAALHQAVLNIGANACQHTDGDIEIALDATDLDVAIAVIDHGPGIAVDERDRVLLPFTRGDKSRSRVGAGGAGLGLAVVDRLVAGLGGRVEISDTEGGGATVTLTFPRQRRDDDGAGRDVEHDAAHVGHGIDGQHAIT